MFISQCAYTDIDMYMYIDCADWVATAHSTRFIVLRCALTISIICRGYCCMYNKSIVWDELSSLRMFCWVMETFFVQKEVIDKLKQLLLFSTEVYEFSIYPSPDEPYCFYKVPSYLNSIVLFVHHTLSLTIILNRWLSLVHWTWCSPDKS